MKLHFPKVWPRLTLPQRLCKCHSSRKTPRRWRRVNTGLKTQQPKHKCTSKTLRLPTRSQHRRDPNQMLSRQALQKTCFSSSLKKWARRRFWRHNSSPSKRMRHLKRVSLSRTKKWKKTMAPPSRTKMTSTRSFSSPTRRTRTRRRPLSQWTQAKVRRRQRRPHRLRAMLSNNSLPRVTKKKAQPNRKMSRSTCCQFPPLRS
jgi:hypothetical protein